MRLLQAIAPLAAILALSACSLFPKEEAPPAPPPPAAVIAPVVTPTAADTDWIDPDTGHRVVRLSNEPGTLSLYFHQNAFTPQGDALIVNSPSGI